MPQKTAGRSLPVPDPEFQGTLAFDASSPTPAEASVKAAPSRSTSTAGLMVTVTCNEPTLCTSPSTKDSMSGSTPRCRLRGVHHAARPLHWRRQLGAHRPRWRRPQPPHPARSPPPRRDDSPVAWCRGTTRAPGTQIARSQRGSNTSEPARLLSAQPLAASIIRRGRRRRPGPSRDIARCWWARTSYGIDRDEPRSAHARETGSWSAALTASRGDAGPADCRCRAVALLRSPSVSACVGPGGTGRSRL
jgi:hypothetical protein